MLDAVLDAVLPEAEAAVEEHPDAGVKAARMKVRRLLARGEAPSAVLLAIANAGGDFRPDSPARTA